MKAGKLVLAVLLAGGAVAAYIYFPDPLRAAESTPAAQPGTAGEAAPPADTPAPNPAQ